MATCPNTNLPQWKELVASRGENMAYFLWDTYNGEVPQSESKQAILRASIKSIDILSSRKAKQVFAKGEKNNWTLDKTLTELQVPKDQKEIILNKGITNREEIITSLLAENSFIVEVNTAKKQFSSEYGKPTKPKLATKDFIELAMQGKEGQYYIEFYVRENPSLQFFDTLEEANLAYKEQQTSVNSDYYSTMAVPGGTNYTENEITTPDITPNIKGHAQFSTDNGIGWFRSDEQTLLEENIILDEEDPFLDQGDRNPTKILAPTGRTNTRRILEVQSDLFQKGRDKEVLITDKKAQEKRDKAIASGAVGFIDITGGEKTESDNQFLQLLNKKE